MSEHPESLPRLLGEAGIENWAIQHVEPINTGVTNLTSLVVLQDDKRYILREYVWPHPSSDDLHRIEKEITTSFWKMMSPYRSSSPNSKRALRVPS